MISYELYSQIRLLHQERGLNFAQIARELNLDEETVAKWARAKHYIQGGGKTLRKRARLNNSWVEKDMIFGNIWLWVKVTMLFG